MWWHAGKEALREWRYFERKETQGSEVTVTTTTPCLGAHTV